MSLDSAIVAIDQALRTLFGSKVRVGRAPGAELPEPSLSLGDKRHAGALMRINHVGEVCAQALYQGQALTARDPAAREALRQAAKEEVEHLAWTGRRIRELGGRPSVLNPLWYGGSLLLGVAAGLAGDRWNLGFLAETEHQVGAHLRSHLERLPEADSKSRAIVGQMYEDEIGHAQQAEALGAASLPQPLPQLMQVASKVMTTISYRL